MKEIYKKIQTEGNLRIEEMIRKVEEERRKIEADLKSSNEYFKRWKL